MNTHDELVRLFLDDPDALSDDELQLLSNEVRQQSAIAERLKDHLLLAELLSRRFSPSRQSFVDQVNRRIRSETAAQTAVKSQPVAPAETSASLPAKTKTSGRKTLVFVSAFAVCWAVLLAWLETTPWANKIGFVASVNGPAFLERNAHGVRLVTGMPIVAGDQIETLDDSTTTMELSDKTRFELSANSIAHIAKNAAGQPQIHLDHGQLSVSIPTTDQQQAVYCTTPIVTVKIAKGRFPLEHTEDRTIINAEEGLAQVSLVEPGHAVRKILSGQIANVKPQDITIETGPWPSNADRVVFLLPPDASQTFTAEQGLQVFATGPAGPFPLRPRQNARFEAGEMVFENGAFLADQSAGEAISRALRTDPILAIELTILPENVSPDESGTILAFSTDDGTSPLAFYQDGDSLGLKVPGPPAESRFLGRLIDTDPQHVVVVITPQRLQCFIDGELAADHRDIEFDLSSRPAEYLVFGNDWLGETPWKGTLEGIVIYSRELSRDEIRRNGLHFRLMRQSTKTVEPK